jgi:hypothetical protein
MKIFRLNILTDKQFEKKLNKTNKEIQTYINDIKISSLNNNQLFREVYKKETMGLLDIAEKRIKELEKENSILRDKKIKYLIVNQN